MSSRTRRLRRRRCSADRCCVAARLAAAARVRLGPACARLAVAGARSRRRCRAARGLQPEHGLCRLRVLGRDHDLAPLGAERPLEVLRQQARVVHILVVDDRSGARAQLVGGELGAGRGLGVVSEAGEEQPVGHLPGEPRRSRATGHERDAGARRDGRRREHLVGVGEADDGRAAGGDEVRRRLLHVGLVGLAVALQELDAAAHQPAALVDAVHRETRAVQGGDVQARLVAGEVVDRPDAHRRWSGLRRRCRAAAGHEHDSQRHDERRRSRRAHERRGPSACPLAPHESRPMVEQRREGFIPAPGCRLRESSGGRFGATTRTGRRPTRRPAALTGGGPPAA